MVNKIYFKKITDLYPICKQAGFQGSIEDFMRLNIGQVFAYVNIVILGDYTEH